MRIIKSLIVVSIIIFWINCSNNSPNTDINHAPIIIDLILAPDSVETSGICIIYCIAEDPDKDTLKYSWSCSDGDIDDYNEYIKWHAPNSSGVYQIKCKVTDSFDHSDSATADVIVFVRPQPKLGLVGYWPFNGNPDDESGYGNNGHIINATFTSDRFDIEKQAILRTGNSYVNIPKASIFEPPNFSISLWMNTGFLETNQYQTIISKNDGYNSGFRLILRTDFDSNHNDYKKLLLQVSDTYGQVNNLYSIMKIDQKNLWYHLAISFEGGQTMRIYINGQLDSERGAPSGWSASNSLDLTIGRVVSTTYTGYFLGSIDDVRFYDRVLTKEEVFELYNF